MWNYRHDADCARRRCVNVRRRVCRGVHWKFPKATRKWATYIRGNVIFRWSNILVAVFLCRFHVNCKVCDMITMNTTYFHIIIQTRGHSLPPYTGQIAEWALLQCIDVSKPRVSCTWQPWNKYEIYTASDVVPRVCYIQLVVFFHDILLYPIVV